MPAAIVTAAILVFWIVGILDVIAAAEEDVRRWPKTTWVLVVLFLSVFGVAAWFAWGRPRGLRPLPGSGTRAEHPARSRRGRAAPPEPEPFGGLRSRAPDDDADFLASLGDSKPSPPRPRPDGTGDDTSGS